MARQDQILRFLVEAEGADALRPFLQSVKDLEGASDETRKAADALLSELESAAGLSRTLSEFKRLEDSLGKLSQRYDAAKLKVDALAKELASTDQPSRRQVENFDNAQRALDRLGTTYSVQQAKLQSYSDRLKAAGVSTENFAEAQQQIRDRGAAAAKGLDDLAKGADRAADSTGTLGTLMQRAGAAFDAATAQLDNIGAGVGRLRTSLTELNQGLELAQKAFSTLRGVADFFLEQATAAGTFEDSLAALQAVTGATADEMRLLEQAAVSASQQTRFSSTEAAQGLAELSRAGFDAKASIELLNPVLALAQGQQLEVARAAEFVTTTLRQFGLEASESGRVADVLAKAADASSTSVEELGNAMSYAAPLAKAAGVPIEEMVGILGALANEGFRGERAGTALRNVFSALSDPSSQFVAALRQAGIASTDFTTVITELAGGGDRAKTALLSLDAAARPAILALVNTGGAGIAALTRQLNDAGGAADRTAQLLGETFLGALDRARNALDVARNTFLAPLLPVLQEELDTFAASVARFAASDDFRKIAKNFAAAVDEFIDEGKRLASELDFKGLIADVREFSTTTVTEVRSVVNAFEELVRYPLILSNAVKGGAAVIVESFAGVANDLAEIAGYFSDSADNAALFFDDIAKGAREVSDAELAKLKERLAGIGSTIDQAAAKTAAAGDAAQTAKTDFAGLALSLAPQPVQDFAAALQEAGLTASELGAAITDVNGIIAAAGGDAQKAGADIEKYLQDRLQSIANKDAPAVGDALEGVFDPAAQSATQAAAELEKLQAALGVLDIDIQDIATGFSEAGRSSIQAFGQVSAEVSKLGLNAQQQSDVIARAFDAAFRDAATRPELEALQRQLVDAFSAGKISSEEFQQRMAQLVAALAELDGTAASGAESTRQLGSALRETATAARDTADAAERGAEATENFGYAAAAASASFGDMSQELIEMGLQMQSQAKNGRDIIKAWDSVNQVYKQSIDRINAREAAVDKELEQLDEQKRALRELGDEYRGISDQRLAQLLQKEEQLRRLREKGGQNTREAAAAERELRAELEQTAAAVSTNQLTYQRSIRVDVFVRADASAGNQTLSEAMLQQISDRLRPELTRAVLDEIARERRAAGG